MRYRRMRKATMWRFWAYSPVRRQDQLWGERGVCGTPRKPIWVTETLHWRDAFV
jgi:hypothetical protein